MFRRHDFSARFLYRLERFIDRFRFHATRRLVRLGFPLIEAAVDPARLSRLADHSGAS
jgi:hypothetical protein